MKLRAASWRRRPAWSSTWMKTCAEPSRIGTSGPSSSTTALSMARADMAAIRCSMVETLAPASLAITVPRRVWPTASAETRMALSPSLMSVRMKVTPASMAAGRTTTRTWAPV